MFLSRFIRPLSNFATLRLQGRADLKSIISNSGWLLFEKALRLLLGLFVSAWVARYLGPAEFGELAYVIAFISFFQAVATLGADAIVVRNISRDRQVAGEVLGTTFILRLVVGVICWACAILLIGVVKGWSDRAVILTVFVGLSLVFQAADTIDLWFQSQSQNRKTVLVKVISYTVSNALKIALVLFAAPLSAFAIVISIEVALAAAGLWFLYSRSNVSVGWKFTRDCGANILRESWPFIISGLSIITYMRIDQLMIGNMLGADSLGLYSAIMPLSSLWHVIPLTLCVSISPFVAKKKVESEVVYNRVLLNIFRGFLVSSVLISVSVAFAAKLIVGIIYGPVYAEAATALSIHIFTVIPVFLGVARSLWIVNEERPILALYAASVGGIASVLLNFLLIPRMGIQGAAVAAVLSYFISGVLLTAVLDRRVFLMQLGIQAQK